MADILSQNRKARHNYTISDTFEAGIVLCGTEVKSIRDHLFSIDEAYADIENGEVWLHSMSIQPYKHGNRFNHEVVRPRKLLMHKTEINRLRSQLAEKGYTLVPLDVHMTRGKIKLKLGLGKGKAKVDKREDLKTRDAKRETDRAIADARRR
ncbi:MAG: SsrA-binding protein [Kiritimatiellia bacterium]|jgi:SsrA-binding protein